MIMNIKFTFLPVKERKMNDKLFDIHRMGRIEIVDICCDNNSKK